MEPSTVERRLTAILCADVAGYSRLMGDDEPATVRTLTEFRQVFVSYIQQHHGRVVDAKGDAIMAEFASVVDAVAGAVEIQRELAERNAEMPGHRRMDFRIGINTGDVVVQDDAIYGDGVNVAARLESIAEPGGICISRGAYDQVRNKLPLEYEDLGERSVKNIAEPVRVFRVLSTPGSAAHRVVRAKRAAGRFWRKWALAAALVVILAGGALAGWYFYLAP
ncbi:MAG: adenylate/guanylate cyclase domain-containing protein, partial [SAR324 cluster bacterium]|nr:adenylate/guanylate cyclase domain-containing protein [SAR324 cluster bacterium]